MMRLNFNSLENNNVLELFNLGTLNAFTACDSLKTTKVESPDKNIDISTYDTLIFFFFVITYNANLLKTDNVHNFFFYKYLY